MSLPVEITVALTPGDYFHVNLWNVFRRQRVLMGVLIFWCAASLFALAMPAFWRSIHIESAFGAFGGWAILSLALGLVRLRSRRAYAANRALNESGQWAFDEDGIHCRVAGSTSRTPWSPDIEVRETRRVYLFFLPNLHVLIFPRRGFASPADEEAFIGLLIRKLGPNARLRSRKKEG